jgi:hypothetical protein
MAVRHESYWKSALLVFHDAAHGVPSKLNCAAPWHAGMAYALGYLRAALQVVENEGTSMVNPAL